MRGPRWGRMYVKVLTETPLRIEVRRLAGLSDDEFERAVGAALCLPVVDEGFDASVDWQGMGEYDFTIAVEGCAARFCRAGLGCDESRTYGCGVQVRVDADDPVFATVVRPSCLTMGEFQRFVALLFQVPPARLGESLGPFVEPPEASAPFALSSESSTDASPARAASTPIAPRSTAPPAVSLPRKALDVTLHVESLGGVNYRVAVSGADAGEVLSQLGVAPGCSRMIGTVYVSATTPVQLACKASRPGQLGSALAGALGVAGDRISGL